MTLSESKDFVVHSSNLKEVRIFSREVFEKINLPQEQKDELVLAIAEAAQNIVKHAYKDVEETKDKMQIKISFKDNQLEIGFFDKGKPVIPENIQHRKLDDIKPGGLGTFFIKQIMDEAVFKKDQKGWVNHLVLTKTI
ncbi:ATP-binding protein [Pelagibacteraceae bacterium]|jgi:serine/threonine-protein kinase RsbW|uniref:ATP-binding protein n=1 Tax=Pelagibacter sp. (strain IMCC9063) TaxID=1002672 RepID=UPI0002046607|nr:ATP-binding protein [Candidatus Pelagibacter sp. IMCC9063]MDA7735792.1 ATP-binding protein [Pelagibacteraceae bacterium]AEA80692.1 putative anti-sigma regulatory factor, serine/threonine protein kinase [Candidatus Pelagibacter sp. IMCC9063]MDA9168475.1 ATP-binding protein [Pelagibacteraceae bacterium]MDB4022489.1 ATP-binding protein [Pelagibacteraceae bacterium]MDC0413292.1 ATP-binding protein [Pelagibacteraceae bacterium]|tara:strand:+ start:274 stop:687 length:414 start_codon:yes stop_codon:yes gene_type:complete